MRINVAVILAVLALPACSVQEATHPLGTPEHDRPASSPLPTSTSTDEQSTEDKQSTENVPGDSAMKKSCGGAEMRLTLSAAKENVPAKTTLEILLPSGGFSVIQKPQELEDYSVVGLACAVSATDGKPYFVVQYGELPTGCAFCEWYYLYDAEGNQLTRSIPSILLDESLPEAQRQSANTKEYEAMIIKLGIEHPEVDYIE